MSFRRKILVKDVYNPKKMHSLLVDEKEPIRIVIKHFTEDPCLGSIFVTSKERNFKGVITRYDLLNWAKFKLGAGIESDAISIEEVDRYIHSTKAKEIISKYSYRAFVKPEDNIIAALDLMLYEDLITVPVVDDQGKIIGDIKLSEILHKISGK